MFCAGLRTGLHRRDDALANGRGAPQRLRSGVRSFYSTFGPGLSIQTISRVPGSDPGTTRYRITVTAVTVEIDGGKAAAACPGARLLPLAAWRASEMFHVRLGGSLRMGISGGKARVSATGLARTAGRSRTVRPRGTARGILIRDLDHGNSIRGE